MLPYVLYASSSAFILAFSMNKANILLYVALLIFLSFNELLDNIRISPLIFFMLFIVFIFRFLFVKKLKGLAQPAY
jgi:hypothetical protein